MKYYISDLHFGHRNIIDFEHRPFSSVEEMDEDMIRRWNNKVKKGDDVYILGDFSYYKDGNKVNEILKSLNGKKFLIKGNHDHLFLSNDDFDESLFIWIKDYAMIKDDNDTIILFHYPIQVWNEQHHGALHFYGHVHSNIGTFHPMKYEIPNSYNVGIDKIKEPMTKNEILEFYKKGKLKL